MGTGISSEPRILRIDLPPAMPLLSLNDRIHHMSRSKITKLIRIEAAKAAKAQSFLPFRKARIRVIFRAPDNRRRDFISGNLISSVKPAIDGLVDAGVLRDDRDGIIVEMSLVRGENLPKLGQLIIQVIEVLDD